MNPEPTDQEFTNASVAEYLSDLLKALRSRLFTRSVFALVSVRFTQSTYLPSSSHPLQTRPGLVSHGLKLLIRLRPQKQESLIVAARVVAPAVAFSQSR